jgi:nitroimidazol reductase NimA-like FMN-containing flavoprotein (pyridoxamine 5'-phosphate oxidase superfamily)
MTADVVHRPEMIIMTDEFDITVTELDEETCWRLLARAGFGRVGFVDSDDELVVLPVNAGVHDRRVIFRTAEATSLARRGDGAMVAFEADHTDPVAEAGWSVVVRGRLRDVTDKQVPAEWHEFAVHPWAPPPRDRWMVIEPVRVTGRMVERHRRVTSAVRVPYMPPD